MVFDWEYLELQQKDEVAAIWEYNSMGAATFEPFEGLKSECLKDCVKDQRLLFQSIFGFLPLFVRC